jgi:4-amino-4-deoxy-L-arabinose transferase-like glycosyltransferase
MDDQQQEQTGLSMLARTANSCLKTARKHALDITLLLIAIAITLPTLAYPLFRDQAHHFYVGRWWIEGLQPYRDAFDLKPPFIFGLHAIGCALFGVQQWWIRLLDILATLGIATLAAWSVPRRATPRPGERGAIVLMGALLYYSLFDFVCTAQCEAFMGLFLFLGWLCILRLGNLRQAAFWSGVCSATAIGFKTPGLVPALGLAILLGWRAWKQDRSPRLLATTAGIYLLGGLAIGLPTLIWFAAHGALGAMGETLTAYTMLYAQEKDLTRAGQWWRIHYFFVTRAACWTWVAGILSLSGIILSVKQRDPAGRRYAAGAALLLVLTLLCVIIQGRFFGYHWVILFPFTMALIALGVSQLFAWRHRVTAVALPLMAAIALLVPGDRDYCQYLRHWLSYADGTITRPQFLDRFRSNWQFNARDSETLALRVRQLAHPGDRLACLNREPNINVLADLRAPTAHPAWYPPMTIYKDGEWVRERDAAIRRHEVRFVVVPTPDMNAIASLRALGYRTVAVVNALTLMEGP